MKSNLKRIISLLLILLVVITCASMLFGCNDSKKKKERDARERSDSVVAVKDAILGAIDDKWSADLDDGAIAKLDNAGDFVVTNGWADLVCEILKNSALQTGKLTALKNAAASEEGQKLLADFNSNAQLLIPIMRSADFTSTDISNIVYDLICSLVSDSGRVIDGMLKRLTELRDDPSVTIAARKNIDDCNASLSISKGIFVPSEQEQTEMLAAFAKAKAPMSELISFAYNMSVGSITDNIFEALFSENGALGNITDSEIYTIISTLLRSVTDLKIALDDNAIKDLNAAMALIINKFDTALVASSLYSQIVQYAKYAFAVVDAIPALCDMVSSAGRIFDDPMFLRNLREAMSGDIDDETKKINSAIVTAQVLLKIREDFTAEELCGIIDKVIAQMSDEYQKTLPVMALDIALNISTVLANVEKDTIVGAVGLKHDILKEEDIATVIGSVFLNMNLDNFKQTFAEYKSGEAGTYAMQVATAICAFDLFGIKNDYAQFSDAWYNYYVITGVGLAQEKIIATLPKIAEDIKAFVDDFYDDSSDSFKTVESIAKTALKNTTLSKADKDAFNAELQKCDMLGIVELLALIING